MQPHINVSYVTIATSRRALIAYAAMGWQWRYGVGVAELVVAASFASTPTSVRGEPTAGNVGVLDVSFAPGFAETSTLSAAAARGGKTDEVGVATSLVPSTSATTSTPAVLFLEAVVLTSVADLDFVTISAATLVTNQAMGGGTSGGRRGTKEGTQDGRGEEVHRRGQGTCTRARPTGALTSLTEVTRHTFLLTLTSRSHGHGSTGLPLMSHSRSLMLTSILMMAMPRCVQSHFISRRLRAEIVGAATPPRQTLIERANAPGLLTSEDKQRRSPHYMMTSSDAATHILLEELASPLRFPPPSPSPLFLVRSRARTFPAPPQ